MIKKFVIDTINLIVIQLLTWDNVLLTYFVQHPPKDPEMIHPCYLPKKVIINENNNYLLQQKELCLVNIW